MASYTKRGQGSCPSCGHSYNNRYKPPLCEKCQYDLGGSYVPKKKAKLTVPKCTMVAGNPQATWYSCNTSSHDDRCIVIVEHVSKRAICHHSLCKNERALYINSKKMDDFACKHVKLISEVSTPLQTHSVLPSLDNYPCDDATRESLQELQRGLGGMPVAVQVSPKMYCVFGLPSTNNPTAYCHVKVDPESDEFKCCSKDCTKQYAAKTKQLKAKRMCLHVHVLLCLEVVRRSESESSEASNIAEEIEETNTESQGRISTITLNMKRSLPETIPPMVVRQSGIIDATSAWTEVFEPSIKVCGLCSSELGPSRPHSGSRGNSYLLTNLHPFKRVKVLVKICGNSNCCAMNQVFPYEMGLFNVSDKVLVSFEILLEWRQLFKRGVPISIAIKSKLEAMAERVLEPPSKNEMENICNLLYNGFYCFETITVRNLDEVICGLCGITGEVYLGDGNEKNCCSVNEIIYPTSTTSSSSELSPIPLEEFLLKFKRHWVECSTYTRSSSKLSFKVSDIPPIIAPSMRGEEVYNTELKKKSTVLKAHGKTEGDPALLHSLIKHHQLDINNLRSMDLEALKEMCGKCLISTSKKSKEKLIVDIQCLYETLLVGSSPCHNFTKVPGHTGGFYHIVCRHGVTAASKFLTLQESVRDAADLYLSFKHYPLVFLCDTACGFVRHMDCRSPVLTDKLWGKFSGCFEEPKLDVPPNKGMSVPAITTAEYRNQETPLSENSDHTVHPLSGNSRRYVLGDRFHNASNPHKSPLCLYHDINLAEQSYTIKTSYQEVENNRKNIRRLRSSCVQNFGTHFLYNFLMDYYQNQSIVKDQYHNASLNLKDNQQIVRDKYARFVIQDIA